MAISTISKNNIIFNIPNSEAPINCQRLGIKNRTVGQYYVGNNVSQIEEFLGGHSLSTYLDLSSTYILMVDYIKNLESLGVSKFYKNTLTSCFDSLSVLKRAFLEDNQNCFIQITKPILGFSKKYLKIKSNLKIFTLFQDLMLGDLVDLVLEKNNSCLLRIYLKPNSITQHYRHLTEYINHFNKLDSK